MEVGIRPIEFGIALIRSDSDDYYDTICPCLDPRLCGQVRIALAKKAPSCAHSYSIAEGKAFLVKQAKI